MGHLEPDHCHRCRERLAFEAFNQPNLIVCGNCGSAGAYFLFPAYYSATIEGQSALVRLEEQASCYFHPSNAATVACEGCGRFLCSVCDIEIGRSHICTYCLQAKKTQSTSAKLENERVLHDSVTFTLAAAVPFLFWPAAPFTAPYALYRAIRYYNAPTSIMGRSKWRLIVSMLLCVFQIIGTAVLIYFVVKAI